MQRNGGRVKKDKTAHEPDEIDELLGNVELLADGIKLQVRQLRTQVRNPTLMRSRVEQKQKVVEKRVMEALAGLRDVNDLIDRNK